MSGGDHFLDDVLVPTVVAGAVLRNTLACLHLSGAGNGGTV